ncbi:MAG: hypothetical protein IIA92_13740 [Chloroflexi bacterium]|nr:hypothetical protein [Chloroflexota bacterium]
MSGINNPPASVVSAFAAPAFILGTSNVEGAASTAVRSDATILAYDATVPVTQAFSDAAAAGAAAVAARRDHRHGMMAAPAAGAVTHEGGNTTEATTTSTTPVDLLTVSGLSIAVGLWVNVKAMIRKGATVNSSVGAGLKINSTIIGEAAAGAADRFAGMGVSSVAESRVGQAWLGPRITNYVDVGSMGLASGISNSDNSVGTGPNISADTPIATITTIVLRGDCDATSGVTMGADELQIYSLATS